MSKSSTADLSTNSWIWHLVLQYVSAQNVSLAHLLYEARIHSHDLGGNAYAVCDPGPPFRYSDLYGMLSTLPHPSTPVIFSRVHGVPLLLLSYLVEGYVTFQRKYASFLPEPSFTVSMIQPAMFNYSTAYIIYDDSRAGRELGYNPKHDTLEGLSLHVLEWNEKVERRLAKGETPQDVKSGVQNATVLEKSAPVPPKRVAV